MAETHHRSLVGNRLTVWRGLALLLGLLLTVSLAPLLAAQPAQTSQGQELFQEKCAGCHTIGGGDLVGPDLQGVVALRDPAWLARWIAEPDQMIAEGDPIAMDLLQQYNNVAMPNLGLTTEQTSDIIAYLADPGAAGAAPATTLPAGDAARGKNLFIGEDRFSNGGPSCMACHSVSGIGALGGGVLGPDLTSSYNKWGEAGLISFVTAPATQTMSTIWTSQPLTPQESADMLAFLQQTSVSTRPAGTTLLLAGLAVIGAALLLVITQLTWRKRLSGVRRRMVAGARR